MISTRAPPSARRSTEEIVDLPCFIHYSAPPYTCRRAAPVAGKAVHLGGDQPHGEVHRHETMRVWGEIVDRAPGSRILFKDRHLSDRDTRRELLRMVDRCGMDRRRVDMMGEHDLYGEHLSAFSRVDVQRWIPGRQAGGISSAEALYMGVPVVTRLHDMPAGRAHRLDSALDQVIRSGLPPTRCANTSTLR